MTLLMEMVASKKSFSMFTIKEGLTNILIIDHNGLHFQNSIAVGHKIRAWAVVSFSVRHQGYLSIIRTRRLTKLLRARMYLGVLYSSVLD